VSPVPGCRRLWNHGANDWSAFGGAAIMNPTAIRLLSEIIDVSPGRRSICADLFGNLFFTLDEPATRSSFLSRRTVSTPIGDFYAAMLRQLTARHPSLGLSQDGSGRARLSEHNTGC
jgi:hypothetical protein